MIKVASVLILMLILISTGTLAYMRLEKWDWVDALYFTTTTLTTIGFGDLHPTSSASKLFTVVFVLTGVSFILFSLTMIAEIYFNRGHEKLENKVRNVSKKLKETRKPWRRGYTFKP